MKRFIDNLLSELAKGTAGPKANMDNGNLNHLADLYLSVYAGNRNLSGKYHSVDLIKKTNKEVMADTLTVQVPLSYQFNQKMVLFKEDVYQIIPEIDWDKPKQNHLDEINELVGKQIISGFSANTFDPSYVMDDIVIFPIKNISYRMVEVIPCDYMKMNVAKTEELLSWNYNNLEINGKPLFDVIKYLEEISHNKLSLTHKL